MLAFLRPWVIAGALGALLATALVVQTYRVRAFKVEAAQAQRDALTARAEAQQAREAADVLAAHYERLAANESLLTAATETLRQMDGWNDPTSPLVAAALGCLRAAREGKPCP